MTTDGGNKKMQCDLVMKGGITSGVIYPKLVTALSNIYDFRSIGGTSAGAIAAAAAAAAQLGVKTGTNLNAFDELEKLPQQLGGPSPRGRGSMLLNLFQPQNALRRHFNVLLSGLNARSKSKLILSVCLEILKRFPLGALVGMIPGMILLAQSWAFAFALSLILVVLGALIGAALNALLSFGKKLPANYFGMCNGMPNPDLKNPDASTTWFNAYLNQLAGKKSDEPLTFGELAAGEISLAMMTTAVNISRPYRLPFEETADFYFVKEELEHFFPKSVMDWMVAHPRSSETARQLTTPTQTFYALPDEKDFPLIVAVRLSLSFPVLLSAVPLYAVDYTLDVNKAAPTKATRIYFSDGGICSNFPVHFFDAPLPTRPTFGVNLKSFHPDHQDERVWLPELLRNNQGLKNYYPSLRDNPGLGSVAAFLWSIVNTMQDWRDNLQLAMPGFRDRIVHVSHTKHEGGLNLNMEPETITTLANSGAEAAGKLIDAFAEGGGLANPNAWDNHQRIRVRTLLSLMEQKLENLSSALERQQNPTYEEIAANPNPPSYKFPNAKTANDAQTALNDLKNLVEKWRKQGFDFETGAPKPSPEMRIMPRI